MVFSGQIGQQIYRDEMPIALPGMYEGMGNYRGLPFVNISSAAQGVYTITPPATVDANATYTLTVDGVTVSVQTGGATTTAQLGALLNSALRAEPLIGRKAAIALNAGTGVITLTALLFNTPIVITTNSATTTNDIVIATTTNPGSENAIVPFGRFVGRKATYGYDASTGIGTASIVDHATDYTTGGGEVLGVTMKAFREKTGIGPTALSGYKPGDVMNVLDRCSEIEGIWVECVETDIKMTDALYVNIAGANAGKATKTTSGTVNLTAKGRYMTDAIAVLDTTIVQVYWNR